ncbi:MAG: TGS domain-containing protein, partial [candidate division Zixibacteria bacterium]
PMTGMMPYDTIQIQLIDTPPISAETFESYLPNLIRGADLVLLVCDLAEPETFISSLELLIDRLREKRIELIADDSQKGDDARFVYKRTVICGHKEYEDTEGIARARLIERFPSYRFVGTSILDDDSIADLKKAMFESLEIIRVYTKQVGKPGDKRDPVILPIGGTVEEAAEVIHKDFAKDLKFAKLWGTGKFDGQRVTRDHILADEDTVEFHI